MSTFEVSADLINPFEVKSSENKARANHYHYSETIFESIRGGPVLNTLLDVTAY